MRIGIVGSGHIGGVVGSLWAKAGHEVLFASRHPENLESLVRRAGANASSDTPTEALAFGEVILLSIPFGALPAFAADHRDAIGTKIVLETGNPNLGRDGSMVEEVT